jgi:ADP-ribosylglycohydrolase
VLAGLKYRTIGFILAKDPRKSIMTMRRCNFHPESKPQKGGTLMKENLNAALWGAFAADALSLGVHWVYNTGVIDKKFGRVEQYYDPLTSYHKGKKAGDFTHYGDQMLLLLDAVKDGGFDPDRFADRWRAFFTNYTGYFDKATTATLDKMAAGSPPTESGSDSDDLAGAARLAALLPVFKNDGQGLVQAARQQTAITHNNPQVIACADFFARTVWSVLKGQGPLEAVNSVLSRHVTDSVIADLIQAGIASQDRETRDSIAEFGQMCSVEAGLPSAIHLIARYADDYKNAMIENVMAGGDSSARGVLAGMVLAAAHGMNAIPAPWITKMNAHARIKALLA